MPDDSKSKPAASRNRPVGGFSDPDAASLFQALAEHSMVGVYIIQDGKLRYANPMLAAMLGRTREELIGARVPGVLIHPDDREKVAEFIRRRIDGEVESMHYSSRALRKDGKVILCEALGRAVELDGRPAIIGTLLDVTEREAAQAALIESEAMFRSLAEKSPNMIFINQGGRVVYANQACEETMGYSREALMAPDFDFRILIAPESVELVQQNFRDHMQGREIPPYEYQLITKDGERLHAIITTRLILYRGELAILGIVTDVTERKQAERELARLLEIESRHRRLAEALARIGLSMTARLELREMLDLICLESMNLFEVSGAFVWLLEGDELIGFAGHGRGREHFLDRRLAMDDGNSLAARIVREADVLFVNQAETSEDLNRELVEFFGVKSLLGIPLVSDSKAIGALMIIDVQNPERFGEQDLQEATLLRSQLALAIESAQLIEQDRVRLEQLAALHGVSLDIAASLDLSRVLDNILKAVLKLVGASNAHIYLYESETQTIGMGRALHASGDRTPAVEKPRKDGLTATVAASAEPLIINDAPSHELFAGSQIRKWNLQAIAGFPLKVEDRVVGVLTVAYLRPHVFKSEEIRLLELLGNQAAIAIQNGRLYDQAQKEIAERARIEGALEGAVEQLEKALERAHELADAEEALRDSVAAVGSTLKVDEVLDRILSNIGRVAPHDTADIMLVVEGEGEERFVAGIRGRGHAKRGLESWLKEFRVPLDSLHNMKTMAEAGAPLVIPDVKEDDKWVVFEETRWIRSYAGAPIRSKGRTLGFLNLCSETPGLYNEEHAERLQAFADQAAVAIENADLYTQSQQEIAERKRAEETLRASKERLKIVFERAPDAYYLIDLGGVFLDANRAAESFTGYERQELIGKSYLDLGLIPTEEVPKAAGLLTRSAIGKPSGPDEFTMIRKDGRRITADVRTYPVRIEGKTVVLVIARDITERQQFTAEIQRLKDFSEGIVQTMAEGIVIQDRSGTITFVNPAAAALLGYREQELVGQNWSMMVPPDQRGIVEAADQRRAKGESDRYELEVLRKDGVRLPVLVSGRPRFEEGEYAGTIAAFTDIRELKKAETVQDEFRRLKEEFILSASHSLRTPLHTLMGFLELLEAGKVSDADKQQEFVQRAGAAARQLSSLVHDLLDAAQLEAGHLHLELEAISLERLVAQQIASLRESAEEADVRLRFSKPERSIVIRANQDRIGQVLTNLLDNAIKVSLPGGEVEVRAAAAEGRAQVEIRDHGPGYTQAMLDSLLEKGRPEEAEETGELSITGLGLYLAKSLVEAHGGRLTAKSKIGEGTRFTISLPLMEKPSAQP